MIEGVEYYLFQFGCGYGWLAFGAMTVIWLITYVVSRWQWERWAAFYVEARAEADFWKAWCSRLRKARLAETKPDEVNHVP